MWRPLEVFLYDWWPIREEARLSDRLSGMPVKIVYEAETSSDAWRSDWPAVLAGDQSSTERRPLRSDASDTIVPRVLMTPDETKGHQHPAEEARRIREAALDQTLEASVSPGDPSSSNPNLDDHRAVDPQVRPDATLEKTRAEFP